MELGQIHILVVDDSVDGADSAVELLTLWEYDAHACYSGASALQSARIRRPAVVLLDLAMPHMDGFQFARLLHKLPDCESVPLIVMSGCSTAADYARAREVGVHHYLLKPSDPTRLKELLTQEIERTATHHPPFGATICCVPVELSVPSASSDGVKSRASLQW
jgi:CheY-like chemotaxis protein